MRRTWIKICGITTTEAAAAAVDAGADAIGFVFAEGSPRRIDLDEACRIRATLPPSITVVAVHRNEPPEDVGRSAAALAADFSQLHGDEDEAAAAAVGKPIIRGFAFTPEAVRRWDQCASVATLLIDGPSGGSGAAFDHAALAAMMPDLSKPVIIAGGLTPETVTTAIANIRPYGVDVSSGVESAPGRKDAELIRAFCSAVRAADARPTAAVRPSPGEGSRGP